MNFNPLHQFSITFFNPNCGLEVCAVEDGVLAGGSPVGRIRRFATVRGVWEEAVRLNLQARHSTESSGHNDHKLHRMSIENAATRKPSRYLNGEGCQDPTTLNRYRWINVRAVSAEMA